MFPKTLVIIISLSRSYTHGGEKIKQTHAPVPAALELRRAVVAKVKAHYYSVRAKGVVLFSSSFEVMICFFLCDVFCVFSCVGLHNNKQKEKCEHPFLLSKVFRKRIQRHIFLI